MSNFTKWWPYLDNKTGCCYLDQCLRIWAYYPPFPPPYVNKRQRHNVLPVERACCNYRATSLLTQDDKMDGSSAKRPYFVKSQAKPWSFNIFNHVLCLLMNRIRWFSRAFAANECTRLTLYDMFQWSNWTIRRAAIDKYFSTVSVRNFENLTKGIRIWIPQWSQDFEWLFVQICQDAASPFEISCGSHEGWSAYTFVLNQP